MAQYGGQFKYKNECSMVSNETSVSCESAVTTTTTQYSELMSLLKAQQTQLDLVIKALTPQTLPPARTRFTRLRRTADGKPICFRCEQSGHIARNCPVTVPSEPKEATQPKPMGN